MYRMATKIQNIFFEVFSFCYEVLQERRAITKLNDKWVIADGLPGEVRTYI